VRVTVKDESGVVDASLRPEAARRLYDQLGEMLDITPTSDAGRGLVAEVSRLLTAGLGGHVSEVAVVAIVDDGDPLPREVILTDSHRLAGRVAASLADEENQTSRGLVVHSRRGLTEQERRDLVRKWPTGTYWRWETRPDGKLDVWWSTQEFTIPGSSTDE
jgi:hypothetical protein